MTRSLLAIALSLVTLSGVAQTRTRYIIGTKAAGRVAASRVIQSNDEMRAHEVRAFDEVNAFAATLSADEAAAMRTSSSVRYVTPVVERHLLDATTATRVVRAVAPNAGPNQTSQSVPYGIDLVRAREVWPVTRGSRSTHVVIFDTGIDSSHPDLQRAYAGGYNTFDPTALPLDDNRHGTHVSGIVAATDNKIGVVGVAPDVDLWMVKVLAGQLGTGSDENVVAAVDWTLKKKAQLGGNWIVSMSFGAGEVSTPESEAIAKLVAAGVLPIAAAGNTGFAAIAYPAAYPGVLSVGAVDQNMDRADFSSFGAGLGVMAPGVDVLSTVPVGSIPSGSAVMSNGTAAKEAAPLIGSKRGDATARLIDCGYGAPEEIPSTIVGNIALMARGNDITFGQKVRNVMAAGAIGAIIYNYEGSVAYTTWSLVRSDCTADGCVPYAEDANYAWPVVVAMPYEEGKRLQAFAGSNATITISDWDDDYTTISGTSMATPHVSGVAALLWSLAPGASAVDIRNALVLNTVDVGAPGVDIQNGWGVVDALASAKFINPGAFGITAPPAGSHRRATRP